MRRLILSVGFCATMAVAFLLLYPGIALARPCEEVDHLYYDSECSEQIGEADLLCDGSVIEWGTYPTPNLVVFKYCCGNTSCDNEGDGCGDEGYEGCEVINCPNLICG